MDIKRELEYVEHQLKIILRLHLDGEQVEITSKYLQQMIDHIRKVIDTTATQ